MVRHNNMIPNNHFHKTYQPRIKTWFDQPMQKRRRKLLRNKKLIRQAPKPVKLLRPTVSCPSVRYNHKLRVGRGFTLQEIKRAGMNKDFVRTVGIAVDRRRRNRCVESLARNVERLKVYQNKLILLPIQSKVLKVDDGKDINKIKTAPIAVKARTITDDERNFQAYVTLRRASCDEKYFGIRAKRKLSKTEVDGVKPL